MIKEIKCDLFESGADAILHQVNCQGVMGSGVAKQVKDKYPAVFECYKSWCDESKRLRERADLPKSPLLGLAQVCYKKNYRVGEIADTQVIINLFAQDKFGYDGNCYTDYEALKDCLRSVNRLYKGKCVAIPYLMACNRGGGNWTIVRQIIEECLCDCNVYICKL